MKKKRFWAGRVWGAGTPGSEAIIGRLINNKEPFQWLFIYCSEKENKLEEGWKKFSEYDQWLLRNWIMDGQKKVYGSG